jgi:sec-independent protein translocase protein TatB
MGIGFLELVIIGVAALILLGPKRLPELMRQAARFYVQIRRTSNDFKSAFDHVVREAENDLRQDMSPLQKLTTEEVSPPPKTPSLTAELAAATGSGPPPHTDQRPARPVEPFVWDERSESNDTPTTKPPPS